MRTYTAAGRISAEGFIPKDLKYASTRDTTSTSLNAIPPEAVLFKSKNAPTRYAEFDIYFANEREPRSADLPDSDLLKALHCYISDFYSRACIDNGVDDWRSFDETALIAFGILMEEASRETLGETGDLVFTEGEALDESHDEIVLSGERMATEHLRSRSKERRVNKRRRISAMIDGS